MGILKEMNPRIYEHIAKSYPQRPEIELFEVIPRRIACYKTPLYHDVPESFWHILYVDTEKAYKVKTSKVEKATIYRK